MGERPFRDGDRVRTRLGNTGTVYRTDGDIICFILDMAPTIVICRYHKNQLELMEEP